MGTADSKFLSKTLEKTIIRYPPTETIASDCESLYSQHIKPNVFSITNFNTLSSFPSLETLSNLSYNNNNSNKSLDLIKINNLPIKPFIKHLNSKIELLDESLSGQNITFDEFSSSDESSSSENSSQNDSSSEPSTESLLSSCNTESSDAKSEALVSEKTHFCFNRDFIQNFKERYSVTKNLLSKREIIPKRLEENLSKHTDCEDSFKESTNMSPNDNNRKLLTLKKDIKYLNEVLLNKNETNKCSKESLSNHLIKNSEISRGKHSMPNSKLDITSHSSINRLSNSLNTDNNMKKSMCYKFWVNATFDTWKVFHNPRDRRIESIGRISGCQIRLTKITQKSPKGMLKRQVYVYSSSLSGLEKCCRLFDDKFPYFCASAGLRIENSVSNRV